MPGMFPQMPGIMGAPMGPPPGMPGIPPMPGMPPMQQPMPMPMGGPAPQVQGGGRPASLGTLPAPSTAEQRAGFGAAVGLGLTAERQIQPAYRVLRGRWLRNTGLATERVRGNN